MPRSRVNATVRKQLQPAHRRVAGLLPLSMRRQYLFLSGHGRPFDFMRVDLYNVHGTIWFGEVTPYPAGGVRPYEPQEFDDWLGSLWTLPDLGSAAQP